jgi:hypothetical protein
MITVNTNLIYKNTNQKNQAGSTSKTTWVVR